MRSRLLVADTVPIFHTLLLIVLGVIRAPVPMWDGMLIILLNVFRCPDSHITTAVIAISPVII